MTSSPVQIATSSNITLDQILESAVVLSWRDLLPGTRTSLVHVEYRLGPGGSLEFLKVWSSIIRGHQYLVCDWTCAPSSVASHVTFSNDFYSKDLAQMLESIIQHQAASFSKNLTLHRDGLVQIHPPTEEDRRSAGGCMTEASHWFVALRQDRRHYTE
jgi:hypothetical protein